MLTPHKNLLKTFAVWVRRTRTKKQDGVIYRRFVQKFTKLMSVFTISLFPCLQHFEVSALLPCTLALFPLCRKIYGRFSHTKDMKPAVPYCPMRARILNTSPRSPPVTTGVTEVALLPSGIWASWIVTQRWIWQWNKRHIHFNCVAPWAISYCGLVALCCHLSACWKTMSAPGLRVDLHNVLSNALGLLCDSARGLLLNNSDVSAHATTQSLHALKVPPVPFHVTL